MREVGKQKAPQGFQTIGMTRCRSQQTKENDRQSLRVSEERFGDLKQPGDWQNERRAITVVRLISDDSDFGQENSGFHFGVSASVCGCTAPCGTPVARGPSPERFFQATSEK